MNRLERPFVGGQPPLFGGAAAGTIGRSLTDGAAFSVDIRDQGRKGHIVRVSHAGFCYVVAGIPSKDDAWAIASLVPAPDADNTHAWLSFVMRQDGPSGPDFAVRVESGDAIGHGVLPGETSAAGDRPERGSFHLLSRFGADGEIPVHAADLDFRACVHDDRWALDESTIAATGGVRSLWLEDASDAQTEQRTLFWFVRREAAIPGTLPAGLEDEPDSPFGARPGDGPVGSLEQSLWSAPTKPSAIDNFRHAVEPDATKRSLLREALTKEAAERAARHRIGFKDPSLGGLTFQEFCSTQRDHQISGADDRHAFRDARCRDALVFAETAPRSGDGLTLWQESYLSPDSVSMARYHVPMGSGLMAVANSPDAARALLYIRAQAAGHPRAARAPMSRFSFAELAANGAYHGYGFTSFAFPDAPGLNLRIKTTEDGFTAEFCEDIVFGSVEEALRMSHRSLMDWMRMAEPEPQETLHADA